MLEFIDAILMCWLVLTYISWNVLLKLVWRNPVKQKRYQKIIIKYNKYANQNDLVSFCDKRLKWNSFMNRRVCQGK